MEQVLDQVNEKPLSDRHPQKRKLQASLSKSIM